MLFYRNRKISKFKLLKKIVAKTRLYSSAIPMYNIDKIQHDEIFLSEI